MGEGGGGKREGGIHIVFAVDPVGILVSICVAFCLHSISRMNGWMDFGQTYTDTPLGWGKEPIKFW